MVDWFGPIYFIRMGDHFKTSGNGKADHSDADSPESKLIGQQITLVPDLVAKASPATYIGVDDPPFFIEHGTKDKLVPTQQSEEFATALEKVLGRKMVTYVPLQGANHGRPEFETVENLDRVFEFLNTCLR